MKYELSLRHNMSTRLFVVLFASFFLIGVGPMVFAASFGSSGAGITLGFLAPILSLGHAVMFIAVGFLSSLLKREALLLLPFGTLIMLVIGALMDIDAQAYPAAHILILFSILLFALSMTVTQRKALLAYILPLSVWAYYSGNNFMTAIPSVTTPLFFLVGAIISSLMMIAIGVAVGVNLEHRLQKPASLSSMNRAIAAFFSFF